MYRLYMYNRIHLVRARIDNCSSGEALQIDSFIQRNDGSIFHQVELNAIASKHSGSILSYLMAFSSGELIGVCPIHSYKRNCTLISYSGLENYEIPYGGWILKIGVDEFDLSRLTKTKYNEKMTYTSYINNIVQVETIQQKESVVLEIKGVQEDTLFNKVESKRRNMIRKAQKVGVTTKRLDASSLRIFYDLLMQMNERTSMISKPCEFYQDIFQMLGSKQVCMKAAFYNDIPIATIMLIGTEKTWHYWQGAANKDYNLGALDLLLWESIKELSKEGVEYFDFCVIDRTRLPNIAKYKLSFGGYIMKYYTTSKAKLSARIINRICRAV